MVEQCVGLDTFTRSMGSKSLPFHIQLAIGLRAISQIEIDKILVRNPILFSKRTKMIDRIFVQTDRELFLRLAKVGILCGFRKVVAFLHRSHQRY